MSLDQGIILIIGMLTGFVSGMFGIGGSVGATPLLIMFASVEPRLAVSSPLAAVIFSALAGSAAYHVKGLINKRLIFFTIIAAIPFGFLGTFLSNFVDVNSIVIIKAALLFAMSIRFFYGKKGAFGDESVEETVKIMLITGAVGGFVSGFVAIGGGIIFVSSFNFILKKNMTEASANSLVCVGIVALFNSVLHYMNGFIDLELALTLAISIVPFAILGAKLNIRLRNRVLELAFGIIMVIFSLIFIAERVL